LVATSVGGVPEMIEDRVSGLLVPPNDVGALSIALETLVTAPRLQDTLGRAARERASRLFAADRQISEMLDTFQEVFSN
jgi:glycosyltransferase involved in cell wall biosynthesis